MTPQRDFPLNQQLANATSGLSSFKRDLMSSALISSFATELRHVSDPSRRLEIVHALGLLICLPSEQAQAPLILQILLDDLETEPSYVSIGAATLQAVARVARHFQSSDGPRLIRDLLNAWPRLFDWLWIRASHLDIPETLPDPSLTKSDYYSATISVLSLYASRPELLRMASENDATPTNFLAARMWYWKVQGIDMSIPASIAPLCRIYLNSGSTPNTQCCALGVAAHIPSLVTYDLETFIQDVNLTDHAVVSTIGSLLLAPNAELAAATIDIKSIEAHLGMIATLSSAPRHTYSFLNHHSPSVVAKVLLSLSNLSPSTADATVVATCVSLCVEHLCNILEARAGFEPIWEALDAMLLPVLVKCYARIAPLNALAATGNDSSFLLSTILSKYLIYISIRDRVSKSLDIIAATGTEALLVPNSPFAIAWSDFKELAIQRIQIQERHVRLKTEIICCNITDCQIYDWKHGHKESCYRVNPHPARKNFPIGNRDLRSVDEVVRYDLKLMFPEIRAAWNASRDGAAPVIIFDYTKHPRGFSIMSADAQNSPFNHDTPRLRIFWKETVEMLDLKRKQGVIVINSAAGTSPYSTSGMITLAELEGTIASTGPLFGPSTTLSVG
ncbi:hypothetical protein B0H16DRAFT_1682068 [Mycena metata]|uniref:Uncharacterized protein n=1 Tax=Mycena metata TaxID=1033252 RepID=A0AAD7KC72_9AGAR|nr:hypothetical protein B0H16DRAFT_1682068 [Mycena metata]